MRLRRKMSYKAQNHKTHEKHLCTCARPHTHFRATKHDSKLQRYTAIYHRGYPHSCTTIQAQNTPPAINCSNIPHSSSQRRHIHLEFTYTHLEFTYTHELTYAAHPSLSICFCHMRGIWLWRACTGWVGLDGIGATCTLDANMLDKSHDHLSTYRTGRLHV